MDHGVSRFAGEVSQLVRANNRGTDRRQNAIPTQPVRESISTEWCVSKNCRFAARVTIALRAFNDPLFAAIPDALPQSSVNNFADLLGTGCSYLVADDPREGAIIPRKDWILAVIALWRD